MIYFPVSHIICISDSRCRFHQKYGDQSAVLLIGLILFSLIHSLRKKSIPLKLSTCIIADHYPTVAMRGPFYSKSGIKNLGDSDILNYKKGIFFYEFYFNTTSLLDNGP